MINIPELFWSWVRSKLSELCKQSLKIKWYPTSADRLDEPCPFCYHAELAAGLTHGEKCHSCICPPQICTGGRPTGVTSILYMALYPKENYHYEPRPGYYEDLYNKYSGAGMIFELSQDEIELVINTFKTYILDDEPWTGVRMYLDEDRRPVIECKDHGVEE